MFGIWKKRWSYGHEQNKKCPLPCNDDWPWPAIVKNTWKYTINNWGRFLIDFAAKIGGCFLKLHWIRKVEEVICVEIIQKEFLRSLRMRQWEKWWADGEKVRDGELAQRGSRSESHGSTAFLDGKINQRVRYTICNQLPVLNDIKPMWIWVYWRFMFSLYHYQQQIDVILLH